MKSVRLALVLTIVPFCFAAPRCNADVVSDYFNQARRAEPYSTEKPNAAMYGTGSSGRMNEASMLRFLGDQDLHDHNIDEAIKKLGKAVMLDPGDPTGHVLYARAITAKLFANKGPIDEELLQKCMHEWRSIALHDADYIEQMEAKANFKRLVSIAKALDKNKKIALKREQMEDQKKAKERLAESGKTTTK